jgi:hypothetical protein
VIAVPRRTNSIVSSRHWKQTFGNRFRLVVSSDLRSQRQCGKTKLQGLNGVTSTPAAGCSSFEIGRIPEGRRATTSKFLCWMRQAMTHARSLKSKHGSRIFAIFPYNGRSVGTAFCRQCRELKIDDLHFHDLRHEGTSRLFEAGFSIEQVALVTGHKDWKMLRRYTHLKPETLHSIRSVRAA